MRIDHREHVEDRIKQLCLNYAYKIRARLSPDYLQGMFTYVSSVHEINTPVQEIVITISKCHQSKVFHQTVFPFNPLNFGIVYLARIKKYFSSEANTKQDCDYAYI